ncbi:M1 family aminopeptidase [Pseudarthrobacter chlorophenolicus]|uniref:M1 family aminopeptidase n=1 Tax=Pseudarthrobacter chlorophenolicus TaxID=85085 RepID=UPI0022865398|nr:M1 family aminopeptidase [Pseudarthrobacter chlorophenolicus]
MAVGRTPGQGDAGKAVHGRRGRTGQQEPLGTGHFQSGRDNLFAEPVYRRGAAALHALRVRIGDAAFFAGANEWLDRYRNSSATTGDFEAVMEEASGQQLDAFFNDWLREGDRPAMP